MEDTKVRQLQPNAKKTKEESLNEELIKRERDEIKDSPFEVITKNGQSWGAMGQYRLTELSNDRRKVKKELTKITWNRVIQVIMILNEINNKLKTEKV
jgi:hypothetical protein